MAKLRPFRGLRPAPEMADKVASPPYDVLNSAEAREMAQTNEFSFLRVNKPEITLPENTDPYSDAVYQRGKENLQKLADDNVLIQDSTPCFYLYAQTWGDHRQVGLVAGASVDEYIEDKIKKHELTREEKEKDRIRHIETTAAQVGPVFLTYIARDEIDKELSVIQEKEPVYDFTADDGIRHTFWVISSKKRVEMIMNLFSQVPEMYVADGHHRSASATIIAQKRREENPDFTALKSGTTFLLLFSRTISSRFCRTIAWFRICMETAKKSFWLLFPKNLKSQNPVNRLSRKQPKFSECTLINSGTR